MFLWRCKLHVIIQSVSNWCTHSLKRYFSATKWDRNTISVEFYSLNSLKMSTAVEQVVACALVSQRARVRSPVGTSFLGEVFSGFFSHLSDICQEILGPQGPRISFGRRNHHSIFALLGWLSVCLVCIVFHVCAVSGVAPALSWSLIREGPPCPCVVKKVCMWSIV